jgi:hypothetical protein
MEKRCQPASSACKAVFASSRGAYVMRRSSRITIPHQMRRSFLQGTRRISVFSFR